MTLELNWPSDVVDRITEQARQRGLSLEAYLLQSVLRQSSDEAPDDPAETRRRRTVAGRQILELQTRTKPDPEGWTSRDYINHGRR